MAEEVMIRYKDVNGYPNRLCKVSKSEEEARAWFEREHPNCKIVEVRWRSGTRKANNFPKAKYSGCKSILCHQCKHYIKFLSVSTMQMVCWNKGCFFEEANQ